MVLPAVVGRLPVVVVGRSALVAVVSGGDKRTIGQAVALVVDANASSFSAQYL